MDETGQSVVFLFCTKVVASLQQTSNEQAVEAAGDYGSVIGCIGITDAMVPPVVIIRGLGFIARSLWTN